MEKLLARLKENKVSIRIDDDNNLKLEVPKGIASNDIIEEVKANKEALIAYIHERKVLLNGSFAIDKALEKSYYTLSSAQRRMYYQYELDKSSLAYNIPEVVELEGEVNKEKVEETFIKLIDRHESLRTRIITVENEQFQQVLDNVNFFIEYIETNQSDIVPLIQAFIRPFNLSEGPLIRVGLIKLSERSHILMIDMHHIITDGISQTIMIKDFMSLYNDEQLSPLPIQYKDYAEWQQSADQQARLASQQKFWKEQFSEEVSLLDLPTDYPRPQVKSYKGSTTTFTIGKEETKRIRQISEKAGATMFMTVLSLFNVLLSKLSSQEDITVGTQVTGRNHADTEGVMGVFINALALRNYPKGDLSFNDFLEDVKRRTLSYFENQAYSFEELIKELRIGRNSSRHPLFDVMFMYENPNVDEAFFIPQVSLKSLNYGHDFTKFDLTLTAGELHGKLHLAFNYSTALFKENTIERFVTYFKGIIHEIITDTNKRISQIDILPDAERSRILNDFNATELEYPRKKTIVDLFEEQVKSQPDCLAVIHNERQMTYKELNERSNQLARYLLSYGVVPGSVVGLLLDRSLEMMVGIIGTLKAGAGYLPIDPNLPEQRVQYMLDQSRATLLLSNQCYMEQHSAYLPVKDICSEDLYAGERENVGVNIKATDLAYCIFTSGSTGLPKGVMIGHRSVINLVKGLEQNVYKNHSHRPLRVALLASYAFDASMQQISGALLQGHSLYISDDLDRKDGNRLIDFYNRNKIDVSDGTPTHLRLLTSALTTNNSLRTLGSWILAGEFLPKELVSEFYEKNNNAKVQLYNFYGPTETCVDSTGYKVDPEKLNDYTTIPIGKPLPNERIYITDAYGNLVPVGVTGELCIAGDGLAQRYMGDADLTSDKFPEDWVKGERRVYRTGDLAKWLPDGNIEYKGRIDHQVKIRGYRVEVAEIERQLNAHHLVKNAVVLFEELAEEKFIVGYYVSDVVLDISELRQHMAEILPEYMIPSYFVHLEKMPLTVNGKVDKKALPTIDVNQEGRYVAPSNDIEEKLVQIWSEVLKLDKDTISVNSRFFELGGHSLRLVFLANKIKQGFSAEFTLAQLIEYQTISSLARAIQQSRESEYKPIKKASEKAFYDLSSVQERLYFLYEFDKNSLAYNMPQVLALEGEVNRARVEETFKKLIKRHESLRTAILALNEKVVQQVVDGFSFFIEYHEPLNDDLDTIIKSFVRPFDLSKPPLIRVGLVKQSKGSHLMIVDMHHIITDGVSQSILINDFMALYNGEKLPKVELQYKDFVEWQQENEKQDKLKNDREFWMKEFSEAVSVLNLPTDFARPRAPSFEGNHVSFTLSMEETNQMKAIADKVGATLFMTTLSIFNILLSKLSNQRDITVGTPVAGRDHVDLEHIVGMFVNTLVLRNYPRDEMSYKDFLTEVKNSTLAYFDHQSFAYEQLVEELNIVRDTSRNPLFDVMFIFQNFDQDELTIPGLKLKPYKEVHHTAMFDLTLIAGEVEEELHLSFNYSTDLFERKTIERFITYFHQIVAVVANNNDVKLSEIDMISEQERYDLLHTFNNTSVDFPWNHSIVDLFELQVANTPQKIAIYDAEESISYSDLNSKTNQLAHHLLQSRIGNGDVVGVMMQRSIDYIINILAVVKSGATYLPLDIAYPNERINHILRDSEAKVLLSKENILSKKSLNANCTVYDYNILKEKIEHLDTTNPKGCLIKNIYMMYTSGSTGVPKGVRGSHEGLLNRLYWGWNQYPASDNEVFCFKTSISFVDHVVEVFSPLLSGITLRIFDDTEILDVEKTYSLIVKEQITRITLVPTYLKALLDLKSEEELTSHSLKYVFCSGEYLPFELAKRFYREFSGATLVNIYGSTEVSADATYYNVERYHVEDVLKYFKKYSYLTNNLFTNHRIGYKSEDNNITLPDVKLEEVARNFRNTRVSEYPTSIEEYFASFKTNVLPYSVNTASPRFIGHMTSVLPDYVHDISKLVSQLNQNLVKIETSKSFTFLEREAIAILHRIFYDFPDDFYLEYVQQLNANLGIITSGGSIANMSAILSARNKLLYDQNDNATDKSIYHLLKSKGYEDMVILGSRLMHYSFSKTASFLGFGRKNILYVESDTGGRLRLDDLQKKIDICKEQNLLIVGLVGIAGATETGTIDPLKAMAEIARKNNIHFHVDAAWGGLLKFSEKYYRLIDGIEHADSITFCGHKQLFLPQGISICLFKDPHQLNHNSTEANYQARADSYDFGRVTLEGSKPGLSLCLHASLKILGKKGYGLLLERGIDLAQKLSELIKVTDCFEFISNHINIVNYRYLPKKYRHKINFSEGENDVINAINARVQEAQFLRGKTFISKTKVAKNNSELVVFRAVLSNPLTTHQDLECVLKDQLAIVKEIYGEDNLLGTPDDKQEQVIGEIQHEARKIPIGKPIANTKILILDRNRKLQPVGVAGELCVAGKALAFGYFNSRELTSQKFIANPYGEGERLYCTGDLARWLPDGNIEFMGRIDNQVKIRGNRVELGEVESQLLSHEDVNEAIVIAKSLGEDPYLVGYYLAAKELDTNELKDHLSSHLPDYMVPAHFVYLENLPLLPNGKINKMKLPDPEVSAGEDYVGAGTEIEKKLVTIWSEILKVSEEAISTNASFFDLGGQSIRVLQLINKIQKTFSVRLELKKIFEKNTVVAIARLIEEAEPEHGTPLQKIGIREFYPTSPAQERMYYTYMLNQDSLARNINEALELGENIDIARLEKAFIALINRHSALRTYFELSDEGVVQKIIPTADFALESITCSSPKELAIAFRKFIKPFDLSMCPLIRGAIVCGLDKTFLFLDIHHIICDGTSINILIKDLKDLYYENVLDELEYEYKDFAVWVREQTDGRQVHKDFWTRKLSGNLNRLNLPILQERENVQESIWNTTVFQLENDQYNKVKIFIEKAGVSDFMFFLAVYYIMLHKVTGDEDIIVGSDAQGRSSKDLQEIVGTFINILPLRMQIDSNQDFIEFLKAVKECVLEALEHQDYPYDQMVSMLSTDTNQLVDVHFAFSNALDSDSELESLQFKSVNLLERTTGEYEFQVEVFEEQNNQFHVSFIYNTALYNEDTVGIFKDSYKSIVSAVLENRSIEIEKIDIEPAGKDLIGL
ncbi:Long-chain-fatty-acid--CoA ligase [Fulvivirga imtechensis AK7]|uniref:Long-chain-fatty-acid--CoA ligase n=1 Tax=Fulvivirga imtechensis AK7 TaxID=1237149 RepID=L8JTH2_9BACT|nr:non-ribosomal peptide synthetase [Fulvivirga imtechensis]ELR72266.1 Long-chain-fatty-acid--CoA ligase [Fulvivirga imtechensis AK7]